MEKHLVMASILFEKHGTRAKKDAPSIRRGEAGLNFFLELELDFKQRTIFELVRASYKHSRVSHRKTWCCAKIIDYVNHRSGRYLKKATNRKVKQFTFTPLSFPLFLSTRVRLLRIHRTVHPIFPPPSSMHHKMQLT